MQRQIGLVDGQKIVRLRKARNWSRAELVRQAKAEYHSVSDIETGKALNPRVETILKMATALDVPIEALTHDGEIPEFLRSDTAKPATMVARLRIIQDQVAALIAEAAADEADQSG